MITPEELEVRAIDWMRYIEDRYFQGEKLERRALSIFGAPRIAGRDDEGRHMTKTLTTLIDDMKDRFAGISYTRPNRSGKSLIKFHTVGDCLVSAEKTQELLLDSESNFTSRVDARIAYTDIRESKERKFEHGHSFGRTTAGGSGLAWKREGSPVRSVLSTTQKQWPSTGSSRG